MFRQYESQAMGNHRNFWMILGDRVAVINKDLIEEGEVLQNLLVAHATGSTQDDFEYIRLRQLFVGQDNLSSMLPKFVRTCRNLSQFWEFIKHEDGTYSGRRQFLWDAFRPLLEFLEKEETFPIDDPVLTALRDFNNSSLTAAWSKALDRRHEDAAGAITAARTLVESTCKHILDELCISYDDINELPKLYKLTSQSLNLAPSQHTEEAFKRILGGCATVIEGLGTLRNKLSDAHGNGKKAVKPAPRHAELAVNLAGAFATFLLATWQQREEAKV